MPYELPKCLTTLNPIKPLYVRCIDKSVRYN